MKKNEDKNLIICGLGGQGVVLLGKILADFYKRNNNEIKICNIMGLGQRGGNVECHIRCSNKKIMSPLIKYNDADIIISFEKNEALRNIHYLKRNGIVICNDYELSTPSVNIGLERDIQEDKEELIKSFSKNIYFLKKCHIKELNSAKMINILILSFFAQIMEYDDECIIECIKNNVKSKYFDRNLEIYYKGKNIFKKYYERSEFNNEQL